MYVGTQISEGKNKNGTISENATVVVSGGGSTLLLKDRGASEELAEAAGKALEKCDFERVH